MISRKIKVEKILDQVQDVLNDTDLTKMVNIIEKKLMEEDYTSMDLAAALLKMSMGDESEDIIDSFETARSLDELDSFGRGSSRGRGRERSAYGNRRKGATDRAAVDYVLGKGMRRWQDCSSTSARPRESPQETFWEQLPESREFRDAWWEALTCTTDIPSWMCPDAMRTMC
mgnify:CR=1 FL=1